MSEEDPRPGETVIVPGRLFRSEPRPGTVAYRPVFPAPTGQPVYANSDGTFRLQAHEVGVPMRGDTVTEADYLAHCACSRDFCAASWSRFVGKIPSPAVLRYLRQRPGCYLFVFSMGTGRAGEAAARVAIGRVAQAVSHGLMIRTQAAASLGISDE